MNDDQIRENIRPLGNVHPLPRMQEPVDEQLARDGQLYGVSFEERTYEGGEIVRRRVDPRAVELPYPDAPLASRRAPAAVDAEYRDDLTRRGKRPPMSDQQYAELTRSIRSHHQASGVRLWLVWHGEPEIAEQVAAGLREVAETLGFTHLDTTVELMEEGPG